MKQRFSFSTLAPARLALVGLLLAAALGMQPAPAAQANGTTRYVATTGIDTGNCTVTPCLTITYAIGQAVAGDTIQVAAGTYTEAGIQVNKNLTFTGAGITATIVQAHADVNSATNRVFNISAGVTVTMERLQIRHGSVWNHSSSDYMGGGILNEGALTLNDSYVATNYARNGGGIYNGYGGTLTLNNSSVAYYNYSTGGSHGGGGGIYNNGTLILTDSTVGPNSVGAYDSNYGGGIFNNGPATLTNSTVSGNVVAYNANYGYGGGIFNGGNGSLTLTNSTVSGNQALGDSNYGGGIFNSATLSLNHSTVTGNTAAGGSNGGGIWSDGGSVNLKNTIVASNPTGGQLRHRQRGGHHFPGIQPGQRCHLQPDATYRSTWRRPLARPPGDQRRPHADPRPAQRQPRARRRSQRDQRLRRRLHHRPAQQDPAGGRWRRGQMRCRCLRAAEQ